MIMNNEDAEQENSSMISKDRAVLSFVRRSARLDARLQRAKDSYSSKYLLDVSEGNGSLRLTKNLIIDREWISKNWGNSNPLIVEIGSGQGENIVSAASANPNTNFLALEVYDPGVAHTMLLASKCESSCESESSSESSSSSSESYKSLKESTYDSFNNSSHNNESKISKGLKNLRIAQVNAPDFFKACDSNVISEIWTFFPDPWPKMKHHKRRIVQNELAQDIHKALSKGGFWRIATDIEDYALHVHEVMDNRLDFKNIGHKYVSLPIEHVGKGNADEAEALPHADFCESERFEGRVLTNFERKGLEACRVIHDITYMSI